MDIQTIYQETIKFAATKHQEQKQTIPGTNLPYIVHVSNVAMEVMIAAPYSPDFNLGFAVQVALLHDTLEDTSATMEDLTAIFGQHVAIAVSALTKSDTLPSSEKMQDSLNRIKLQPKEVWAVKLADRITNLQKPPLHWDVAKRNDYRNESIILLDELTGGNPYLEERLGKKIMTYEL
ncbi:HD domain-containing protein [Cytophaga aurantiaca]|uniref:HD domain-containing protein n=1 Tax=Cytophaga aurantiaca TaxID=29530 RepID=UPI0003766FFA|nr:HD domain-containing protein [Cytophaga aurantiaca]